MNGQQSAFFDEYLAEERMRLHLVAGVLSAAQSLCLPGEVLVSPARLRALERLAVPHGARLRNQGITIREQPTRF